MSSPSSQKMGLMMSLTVMIQPLIKKVTLRRVQVSVSISVSELRSSSSLELENLFLLQCLAKVCPGKGAGEKQLLLPTRPRNRVIGDREVSSLLISGVQDTAKEGLVDR